MKKLFMGIMGALALTACSSEEVIPDKPVNNDNGESRFMTVSIRNADSGTRADSDFENGIDAENKVKNIVFFFFNKEGEAINVINGDKNYFVCEGKDKDDISGTPGDNENVEKLLNATIVLSNGNKDNIKDLYSMVAILNYDEVFETLSNKNLSDLKGVINDYTKNLTMSRKYTYEEKKEDGTKETITDVFDNIPAPYSETSVEKIPYMVMTSSSFVADELDDDNVTKKVPTFEVKDIAKHVHDSETEAKSDAVKMYVERVVAKVRLTTQWDPEITTQIGVTFEGKTNCTAILLKDQNGNEITFNDGTKDNQIYVIFENWGLTGTAPESYLFKNVMDWTIKDWGDGKGWNHASYNRSYWALNPEGVSNTTLRHFPYVATEGNIGSDWFYCLENAADQADGTKSTYNPTTQITNRTQAFIKARLVTLSDDHKTATKLDLAVWGAEKYTTSQLIPAMLNQVNKEIFIRKIDNKEEIDGKEHITYSYTSLPKEMVRLVSGLESELWGKDKEKDKRYISYIKMRDAKDLVFPEGFEKAFFKNINGERIGIADEGKEVTLQNDIDAINKKFLSNIIGGEVFEDGKTYYYTDIEHLGPDVTTGKFGVVRNHLYDIIIKKVTGLGTPVLNPSNGKQEVIIPQKPDTSAFFLAAQINILSWRIVNNNVTLDWNN